MGKSRSAPVYTSHLLAAPAFDGKKPLCPGIYTTHPATVNHHNAYCLTIGHNPTVEKICWRYANTSTAAYSMTDGFVTFAYLANQQPIVQMAPFQETVIQLEAGEKFTNISSGDPSHWSYVVVVLGKGETKQQNILAEEPMEAVHCQQSMNRDYCITMPGFFICPPAWQPTCV